MDRERMAISFSLRGRAPNARVSSPFLPDPTPSVFFTYSRSLSTSPVRLPENIKTPVSSAPCFSRRKLTAPESCRRRNASRSE